MANSPPAERFVRLLAAGCASLLGVASAAAQSPRSTEKIVMDAVPVEVNYRSNTAVFRDVVITQGDIRIEAREANVKGGLDFENGEWTISGDVRIRVEGGNLKADKAVVWFRNNLISRATITGAPAEFEQKREDGNLARGHANTMDYETATGTVSFRENAWLTPDGCNEITGNQMVYNIKTQSMQAQPGGTAAPGAGGRVRIVIQPGAKPGKPCNAAGSTP